MTLTRRTQQPKLLRDEHVAGNDAFLPVTLAHLKQHLVIEAGDTSNDALLTTFLHTAVFHFQRFTDHYLVQQTRKAEFWPYGEEYVIPAMPWKTLTSIEETFEGTLTALDNADYFVKKGPPPRVFRKKRIAPRSGELDGIIITYRVGYADQSSIPNGVTSVLTKIVTDLFEYRTSVEGGTNLPREMPLRWQQLAAPFKLPHL